MADVVITIPVTGVSFRTWLRTSYIASGIIGDDGQPMVTQFEFGPDQEDALNDFLDESVREVLKIFTSRQGDATGLPFEYDGTNVTYRFNEATPLLPQAAAIKDSLNEDVKNAIFVYATFLWFKFKSNDKQSQYMIERYEKIAKNIDRHLYKLHD